MTFLKSFKPREGNNDTKTQDTTGRERELKGNTILNQEDELPKLDLINLDFVTRIRELQQEEAYKYRGVNEGDGI